MKSKTSTRYFETAILREDGKKGILYTGKDYGHAKWAAYHPGEDLRIIITQSIVEHSMNRNELGKTISESVRYDSATDDLKHTVATLWGTNHEVDLYDVIKNAKAN
jgi:hypothetical protein